MAIVITCQCGASFRARDELAGKQVACPKCGQPLAVPSGQPSASAQAPLSIDELMRLASSDSEASRASTAAPLRAPQSQPAPSPSGDSDAASPSSSGMSPLVIGLAVVGSVFLVAVGVMAVMLMLRTMPTNSGETQSTQDPPPTAADSSVSPPQPKVLERVKATPETVGTKGKDYGGGIYTEPLAQRWRIPDRLVLQQVEYALKLFNATEGRYPTSHEEFMEKIVRGNNLKLPSLPLGQRYLYLPETHELMVEREVPAPAKP
jgi:hypothetical protein